MLPRYPQVLMEKPPTQRIYMKCYCWEPQSRLCYTFATLTGYTGSNGEGLLKVVKT